MKYLPDLLPSVANLDYPKEFHSVFMVDSNSEDESLEYTRKNYPEIRIVPLSKNMGFAGGNNVGMKLALDERFDYIVLLNQDAEVDRNWLKELVNAALSDEKIGAVQSLMLLHNEKDTINTRGNEFFYLGIGYSGGYKEKEDKYIKELSEKGILYPEYAYASGGSVLFRAEALKKVGLFNPEHFAYPEDFDLGWRMRLAGYKIATAPKSKMYHKYKFNRHSMRQYYWLERNRYLILFVNYRFATLLLITPMLILLEFCMWGFFILNKGPLWKLKSYGYCFLHIPRAFMEKRRVSKTRKVSDREILRYFTGTVKFSDMDNIFVRFFNVASGAYFAFLKVVVRW